MDKRIIDLSEQNGNVDLLRVKNSGVTGIIQRMGYGNNYVDKTANKNIENALNLGMDVVTYWIMYSSTKKEARDNVQSINIDIYIYISLTSAYIKSYTLKLKSYLIAFISLTIFLENYLKLVLTL